MAQMQDTQPRAAAGKTPRISTITNAIGAILSFALVVGIGIWGYKMWMRDVSGVPVVRAAEGPVRVAPADPGGQLARHVGLSVNDVAAEGGAAAPADTLVLAPPPLDLSLEEFAPVAAPVAPDDAEISAVERLAAQLAEGVAPLAELAPLGEVQPATEEEVRAAIAAATGVEPEVVRPPDVDEPEAVEEASEQEGLGRSLRPQERPLELGNVQPVAALAPAPAAKEIDPDTIPVGTRLAQLGAFDSAETARREWERLNTRFGEYLAGKSRVIQSASSGGRTFYRLRAMGFEDLQDARRFCSALVSDNAECIPVVTR